MDRIRDRLTPEGLRQYLKRDHEVIIREETDSTNDEVKRIAKDGASEGLVVLSERQTAGKARRGRSFFSPAGSGIYMSLLFRPREAIMGEAVRLTTQAAVAVSHVLSELCKAETQIKWVNDIFYRDRKICGILAESVSGSQNSAIDYVVVGIGINVYAPKERIPEELKPVIGYVYEPEEYTEIKRAQIAAGVINELYDYYEALPRCDYMEEYRRRSCVIGQQIRYGMPQEGNGVSSGEDVALQGTWHEGRAVAVDDDGCLVVEGADGTRKVLRSGEVTVRRM